MAYDKDPGGRHDLRRIRFNDYYQQRDWSDCVATATDDAHPAPTADNDTEPLLHAPPDTDHRH